MSQEEAGLGKREGPTYQLTFNPSEKPPVPAVIGTVVRMGVVIRGGSRCLYNVCLTPPGSAQPRVAVVREEGSNGDREMAAALLMAGFEVILSYPSFILNTLL